MPLFIIKRRESITITSAPQEGTSQPKIEELLIYDKTLPTIYSLNRQVKSEMKWLKTLLPGREGMSYHSHIGPSY